MLSISFLAKINGCLILVGLHNIKMGFKVIIGIDHRPYSCYTVFYCRTIDNRISMGLPVVSSAKVIY